MAKTPTKLQRVFTYRAAGDADALRDVLNSHESEESERVMAAQFLGDMHSAAAIGDIRRALTDPSGDVRIAATQSLAKLSAVEASDDLFSLAADPEQHDPVREWATDALVRLRDPRAVPLLEQRLREHPNVHHRRWAAKRLAEVGTVDSIAVLEIAREQDSVLRQRTYRTAIRACAERGVG